MFCQLGLSLVAEVYWQSIHWQVGKAQSVHWQVGKAQSIFPPVAIVLSSFSGLKAVAGWLRHCVQVCWIDSTYKDKGGQLLVDSYSCEWLEKE